MVDEQLTQGGVIGMADIDPMLMGNVRDLPWLSNSHEQDASSMHVASNPGAAKVHQVG